MIENLNRCCSCKRMSIIRCISCDCEIKSICGCTIDKPAKQLELHTSDNIPNIILYICDDCENDIKNNIKNGPYDFYLKINAV